MFKKMMNIRKFHWLILLVNILQCTSELIYGGTFLINKRINGHIIHILSNMGAKMCLRHCHRYKDCNAVNYLPQILKCQLLALTAEDDHLILDSEYIFANMTNWNMDTDSCWPINSCQEDTRCLPTHLNGHACLTFVTPCTANPCGHGYCNITNAGYKCTCDAGYSGVNCEYSCTGSGWVLYGTICYYFTSGAASWLNAQVICNIQMNGKLAEPDTSAKISFLRNRAMGFGTRFWLGGTDGLSEGSFRWASRPTSITDTDWYPGEPNNGNGNGDQDCLCLSSIMSYRWEDLNCATKYRFICEKPYV